MNPWAHLDDIPRRPPGPSYPPAPPCRSFSAYGPGLTSTGLYIRHRPPAPGQVGPPDPQDMTTYIYKRDKYSSHNQILRMVSPGSRVLDIGCGPGILGPHLLEKGCEVVGIDLLPADPSFATRMTEYHQADLESVLDVPRAEAFDYVILADVLEHLKNRDLLLGQVAGYLKPHGSLIASTGNIALWIYRLSLLVGRFEYAERGILDRDHVHLFTIASFRRFIEDAGFRITALRTTPIPFEQVWTTQAICRFLSTVNQALSQVWPKMFAYQVIVMARSRNYLAVAGG